MTGKRGNLERKKLEHQGVWKSCMSGGKVRPFCHGGRDLNTGVRAGVIQMEHMNHIAYFELFHIK